MKEQNKTDFKQTYESDGRMGKQPNKENGQKGQKEFFNTTQSSE